MSLSVRPSRSAALALGVAVLGAIAAPIALTAVRSTSMGWAVVGSSSTMRLTTGSR